MFKKTQIKLRTQNGYKCIKKIITDLRCTHKKSLQEVFDNDRFRNVDNRLLPFNNIFKNMLLTS